MFLPFIFCEGNRPVHPKDYQGYLKDIPKTIKDYQGHPKDYQGHSKAIPTTSEGLSRIF
jgi:hypothetical protein